MSGITYDAGALIAAERNDRHMWALHQDALDRGVVPTDLDDIFRLGDANGHALDVQEV